MLLQMKSKFFVMGLLMNVDSFFVKSCSIFFFFFVIFLLFNKVFLMKIFSNKEMKFMDNLFFIFASSNLLGLTAFFLSFPLWPMMMIFLSFKFWIQSVFNLMKISMLNFMSHFTQENLMILMSCFMVYIEILSITIRFLTLGFRLLANILGGHLMMELANLFSGNLFLMMGLFSYEMFVALIQATIYTILVYYYTSESLEKY